MYFKLPNIKVVVSFVRLVCLIMCIFLSNVCMKINRDTHTCARCNTRFSAYFCSICKLFTGEDKHPYHCTKCGICRLVDTLYTECRKMKCSFLRACDNKKSDLRRIRTYGLPDTGWALYPLSYRETPGELGHVLQ